MTFLTTLLRACEVSGAREEERGGRVTGVRRVRMTLGGRIGEYAAVDV
jgi:hypothetical protein